MAVLSLTKIPPVAEVFIAHFSGVNLDLLCCNQDHWATRAATKMELKLLHCVTESEN